MQDDRKKVVVQEALPKISTETLMKVLPEETAKVVEEALGHLFEEMIELYPKVLNVDNHPTEGKLATQFRMFLTLNKNKGSE